MKIIIIGGGIAGLSAGIYAQMNGFDSEIYEKNPMAGGQCMGWDRNAYHIDNCIHWLTGTKKGTDLYKVWEQLGALNDDIPMIENEFFYSSEHNGKRLALWRDLERTRREFLETAPEDAAEIHKFIEHVRMIEACSMPVDKPMDMMNVIDFMKLGKKMRGFSILMKEYGNENMAEFGNRFKNPHMCKIMTDYIPSTYAAFSLFFCYSTFTSGNGNLPKGGSLAMTNRIIKRYTDLGGKLYTNIPVKKVMIAGNKADGILLENEKTVTGDYVICSTDTIVTFKQLMDEKYMDKKLKKCYDDPAAYPSFSGFQLAFSVDSDALDESLVIFDCEPFTVAGKTYSRTSLKNFAYEPAFAPVGKMVIQTNVLQFDDDFAYWKSLDKDTYKQEKQAIADAIKQRIVTRYPKAADSIELLDSWTPVTYERYCNAYRGSYMAFAMTKQAKRTVIGAKIKGLSNVLLASQWQMVPGGLPTAAASGKSAIQHILKAEGKSIDI